MSKLKTARPADSELISAAKAARDSGRQILKDADPALLLFLGPTVARTTESLEQLVKKLSRIQSDSRRRKKKAKVKK